MSGRGPSRTTDTRCYEEGCAVDYAVECPHPRGPSRSEARHRWVPTEPVPEGWVRGNQCFVDDYLDVFVYDPAVAYSDRKPDGSTDRWIKHQRVDERRYVTEWEPVAKGQP